LQATFTASGSSCAKDRGHFFQGRLDGYKRRIFIELNIEFYRRLHIYAGKTHCDFRENLVYSLTATTVDLKFSVHVEKSTPVEPKRPGLATIGMFSALARNIFHAACSVKI
jgi:hypothetical protein